MSGSGRKIQSLAEEEIPKNQTVEEDFIEEVDLEVDLQNVGGEMAWTGSQENGLVWSMDVKNANGFFWGQWNISV